MVTWSLEGGASARIVQADAGHSSMRTTEIYVHRLDQRVPRERLAAMERMYARMSQATEEANPRRARRGSA
jgi:integrase